MALAGFAALGAYGHAGRATAVARVPQPVPLRVSERAKVQERSPVLLTEEACPWAESWVAGRARQTRL